MVTSADLSVVMQGDFPYTDLMQCEAIMFPSPSSQQIHPDGSRSEATHLVLMATCCTWTIYTLCVVCTGVNFPNYVGLTLHKQKDSVSRLQGSCVQSCPDDVIECVILHLPL